MVIWYIIVKLIQRCFIIIINMVWKLIIRTFLANLSKNNILGEVSQTNSFNIAYKSKVGVAKVAWVGTLNSRWGSNFLGGVSSPLPTMKHETEHYTHTRLLVWFQAQNIHVGAFDEMPTKCICTHVMATGKPSQCFVYMAIGRMPRHCIVQSIDIIRSV